MGFGLLIIGYSALLLLRIVPIEIVGFFIMYLGLEKLSKYEKKLSYAKYAAVFMFAESVLSSLMWIEKSFDISIGFLSAAYIETVENILYHAGLLVFHILLYYGLSAISKVSGYDKGVTRSRFAIVTTGVYYVAAICGSLIPNSAQFMAKPIWIMQIVWMLVNLWLLLGCFMMIVTDEMLEDENKKYAEFIEKNPKLASEKEKKQIEKAKKAQAKKNKKNKSDSKKFTATKIK
ncbi:MAG: hypothetical protein E7621_06985 [Ruminococcaceae bacterium]|nr:hypothetical protein [Oscillospiraceae bacterium]